MPIYRRLIKVAVLWTLGIVVSNHAAVCNPAIGQGVLLPAGGAVNRGMAGATTGTAIESIGSMIWNPATISQLPCDELAFGFEVLYSNYELSSTFPAVGSGSSDAENGASPVPTIAWVHQTRNPNVKFGIGIAGVAGFSSNFRADLSNPILGQPLSAGGTGVGGVKSEACFYQLNPNFALQLTDRLSIAAGPVVGLGKVTLDENSLVAANGDGSYPRGDGTRYHWGLGAQIGFHYLHNACWEFGANIKSPTWYEDFRYFGEDENGAPRTDKVDVDLPMIVSGGLGYKGFEYVLLTLDVRYVGYNWTEGFGDPATYQANGAANGLGWKDVCSVSTGAQFQLTPNLISRVGYYYSTDLFDDDATFFNVSSPLNFQHMVAVGGSYALNANASLSAAYNYMFDFGSTGPYIVPGATIPGSSVTTELDVHFAVVGLNVRY
ncbi:MAG: outer membrane protein transport protein [Rubripirellula sp.]|nr:outer membrane protein transport protein [Rubripirellula sp.]